MPCPIALIEIGVWATMDMHANHILISNISLCDGHSSIKSCTQPVCSSSGLEAAIKKFEHKTNTLVLVSIAPCRNHTLTSTSDIYFAPVVAERCCWRHIQFIYEFSLASMEDYATNANMYKLKYVHRATTMLTTTKCHHL